ncbi:hypothetical protein OH76DRAFT_1423747 [Lentinus brumalis]|uniref:Uncharacterized protein n=1 Tax=Lentinus brumalis TaxID=2498619 RepID=A0A371CJA7_9APHY|nr:hypothetical protein OH76DRAFT_1423747 [Polyporus brumalis]
MAYNEDMYRYLCGLKNHHRSQDLRKGTFPAPPNFRHLSSLMPGRSEDKAGSFEDLILHRLPEGRSSANIGFISPLVKFAHVDLVHYAMTDDRYPEASFKKGGVMIVELIPGEFAIIVTGGMYTVTVDTCVVVSNMEIIPDIRRCEIRWSLFGSSATERKSWTYLRFGNRSDLATFNKELFCAHSVVAARHSLVHARLYDIAYDIPSKFTRYCRQYLGQDYFDNLSESYTEGSSSQVFDMSGTSCEGMTIVNGLNDERFHLPRMVQRAIALLQHDATRKVALSALAMATQYKSTRTIATAYDIAALSGDLARLAVTQMHLENLPTVELAFVVLAQSLRATIAISEPPASFIGALELPTVITAVYSVLRCPQISYAILTHSIDIIATLTMCHPPQGAASLTPFLAAFARCNNIRVRAIAVAAIIRLPGESDESDGSGSFPMSRLLNAVRNGVPSHIHTQLMASGGANSEIVLILNSSYEFRKLMTAAESSGFEPCVLGRKLAHLVQLHDFAIGEKQTTGNQEVTSIPSWIDCLHLCAAALRRTDGSPSATDLDNADVLEMRFYQYRGELHKAVITGRSAINRNPELAYAYFILSLQDDRECSFRMAKAGLQCPRMTPFLRTQLLCRAATHATQLGLSLLQSPSPLLIERGTTLILEALDDTNVFILQASPDNLWMQVMLNWKVFLLFLVRGPSVNPEFLDLKRTEDMIRLTSDFSDFIRYSIVPKRLTDARELLVSSYVSGSQTWDWLVERYDEHGVNLGDVQVFLVRYAADHSEEV